MYTHTCYMLCLLKKAVIYCLLFPNSGYAWGSNLPKAGSFGRPGLRKPHKFVALSLLVLSWPGRSGLVLVPAGPGSGRAGPGPGWSRSLYSILSPAGPGTCIRFDILICFRFCIRICLYSYLYSFLYSFLYSSLFSFVFVFVFPQQRMRLGF